MCWKEDIVELPEFGDIFSRAVQSKCKIAVLWGAGCSKRAGVPTADELMGRYPNLLEKLRKKGKRADFAIIILVVRRRFDFWLTAGPRSS